MAPLTVIYYNMMIIMVLMTSFYLWYFYPCQVYPLSYIPKLYGPKYGEEIE